MENSARQHRKPTAARCDNHSDGPNRIPTRVRTPVLGIPIDPVSMEQALDHIRVWAKRKESRVVCLCNADSLTTAQRDSKLAEAIASADLAVPDGAPVAWMLRRLGCFGQTRVPGPDLMWRYCADAARRGEPVFLYGSTEQTLERLKTALAAAFPGSVVAGSISPPFRPLSAEEEHLHAAAINDSGAATVWVGLGCPKQEEWMHALRGRVGVPMIGVGAAFEFHAGTLRRAPDWMRRTGIEWLYRLIQEPRRLWRRYLLGNVRFIVGAGLQLLFRKQGET